MEHREIIDAVQRMQNYIDANIRSPITLRDLAKAAGYSQWHSARLFKELIGKTPFEYIRALRLSKAAEELQNGHPRIVDVAFDFVFDSHEGFTRAFTKEFGVSPKKYSTHPVPIRLFIPTRIRDYYFTLQKGEKTMSEKKNPNTVFVQVVERPARKMILKRGIKATHYFEFCEEVGCDIWGILCSIKDAIYEPVGCWMPDRLIPVGTSKYIQGVEVPLDYTGEIPEGFEIIDLEPCKMMIFQGEPFEDEKFSEAIEDLWEVMKKYDPKVYGFEWADDDAPRIQLSPEGYRGYIEGRPVRAINK